ncbi:MAG: hypothetical protein H6815_03130 [Phycisphaeraceae bacterium]|nr:hypothetical protein [Phycisphaerales bacterium]MCB9859421.1 hypothetical protein [Phycisphaeraceae bacterium]
MRSRLALISCIAMSLSAACADDLIYFEENGGGGLPRGLYTLDPNTGTAVLRATVGGTERFFSMAQQPGTGTVFAVSVPGNTGLWTIDVDTGATTFVGSTGIETLGDITFHPTTGQMLAIERNGPYRIYEINPATASATLLSTSNANARCGLQFDAVGTLFGFGINGGISQVDATTGNTTFIGGPTNLLVLEDATFDSSGTMFVTDFDGDVFRADPATGQLTLVHNTGMGTGLCGIVAVSDGCYADCDGSGTLNVFDYICFGNAYSTNDPYADCDGNGVLNVFDYICFGNAYAVGCP